MESLKSFLIKLTILTVITEAAALLWYYLAAVKYVSPTMPVLPLFFFALTYIFHRFVSAAANDENVNKFQRRFLVATTIKLILMLIIIVAYALYNPEDSIVFIVFFFILYLIYTAFEARSLLIRKK